MLLSSRVADRIVSKSETSYRRPLLEKNLTEPVPSRTSVWLVIWMWLPATTILASVLLIVLVVFIQWPRIGYESQGKLQEVVNISRPHRAALRIACENGLLRAGEINEELGLPAPQEYNTHYMHSVTARVSGVDAARVEILLKRIKDDLPDGKTIFFEGHCADAQIHWRVSGDIPSKYRELLARKIERHRVDRLD